MDPLKFECTKTECTVKQKLVQFQIVRDGKQVGALQIALEERGLLAMDPGKFYTVTITEVK